MKKDFLPFIHGHVSYDRILTIIYIDIKVHFIIHHIDSKNNLTSVDNVLLATGEKKMRWPLLIHTCLVLQAASGLILVYGQVRKAAPCLTDVSDIRITSRHLSISRPTPLRLIGSFTR